MKQLPFWRRPFGAQKILEVGGGHAPFCGVTHAVDKFPNDCFHRGGNAYKVPKGALFFQGELEALPFPNGERFDFLYASHIFEHVKDPVVAAAEINRVVSNGYIETPSPLREQIACPIPFDASTDFHTLFVWSEAGALHVIAKTAATVGEFTSSRASLLVKALSALQREDGIAMEPMLPFMAKTTKHYFKNGLHLRVHPSFAAAEAAGFHPYGRSAAEVLRFTSTPFYLYAKRFQHLRGLLLERGVI